MNFSEKASPDDQDRAFDANFKPTGAIAFFLILIVLGMLIWYGIYFLMLERI